MPDAASVQPSPLGVVVRVADGSFKVWRDGGWQVLGSAEAAESRRVSPLPQPSKPTFPGPYAAAYFSAAEEQEARRSAQRLDTASDHKRYSLGKIVSQVERRSGASVGPAVQQAFSRAVFTFLRGTRGPVDLGSLLVRSPASGGVGLGAEQSQAIVAVLSVIGDKIRSEGGEVVDDAAAPAAVAVPKPSVKPAEAQNIAPLQRPVQSAPVKPTPPALAKVAPPPPLPRPMAIPPVADVDPAPARRTPPRRLVGPVDELRQMDIATFRTLGATPADQASAVAAKVEALAHDSLARRAEGVAAWRESEVYTVYRAIGIQSIQSGESVAQVTAKLFRDGKPTLTEAEFNAVADCNQRLRY